MSSRQRSSVDTGSAAEPDTINRRPAAPADHAPAGRLVGGLPRRDEPGVDRRHGHEHRDVAGGQPLPHVAGVEAAGRLAAGADGERAQRHVDDAVDVVQRQHEHDAVVGRPSPTPRPSRRPGRPGCRACARRPWAGPSCRSCRSSSPAARRRRGRPVAGPAACDVDDPDVVAAATRSARSRWTPEAMMAAARAVVERVAQLGVGVLGVERHGDGTGVPAGQQRDHEVVAGRGEDGDAVADVDRRGRRRRARPRPRRRRRTTTTPAGSTIASRSPNGATRSASATNVIRSTRSAAAGDGRGPTPPPASPPPAARRRRRPGAPTSWMPTGRPSPSKPAGSDSAGPPSTVIR